MPRPGAQRHGLKIGAIEDLIAYRLRNEHLVRAIAKTSVSTTAGKFDLHVYETTVETGRAPRAGQGRPLGARPGAGARACRQPARRRCSVSGEAGEGTQIANSLRMIEKEGRGVVVLIRDLRPKSVSEWIGGRVQPAKPAEGARERRRVEIGVGSQILTDLGVRDMVLLTNSPAHVYVGLEGFGLRIVGTRRIE